MRNLNKVAVSVEGLDRRIVLSTAGLLPRPVSPPTALVQNGSGDGVITTPTRPSASLNLMFGWGATPPGSITGPISKYPIPGHSPVTPPPGTIVPFV